MTNDVIDTQSALERAAVPQEPASLLVVDDTPANLQLLIQGLTRHGYKVHPAPNGQMALRFALNQSPDLILLDIRMPGEDGFAICTQLKSDERTCSIPIIFLSAIDDSDSKTYAFEVGGDDYVTKPFLLPEVLARVRTHLDLSRTRRLLDRYRLALAQEVARRQALEQTLERWRVGG